MPHTVGGGFDNSMKFIRINNSFHSAQGSYGVALLAGKRGTPAGLAQKGPRTLQVSSLTGVRVMPLQQGVARLWGKGGRTRGTRMATCCLRGATVSRIAEAQTPAGPARFSIPWEVSPRPYGGGPDVSAPVEDGKLDLDTTGTEDLSQYSRTTGSGETSVYLHINRRQLLINRARRDRGQAATIR